MGPFLQGYSITGIYMPPTTMILSTHRQMPQRPPRVPRREAHPSGGTSHWEHRRLSMSAHQPLQQCTQQHEQQGDLHSNRGMYTININRFCAISAARSTYMQPCASMPWLHIQHQGHGQYKHQIKLHKIKALKSFSAKSSLVSNLSLYRKLSYSKYAVDLNVRVLMQYCIAETFKGENIHKFVL